jgi:formylglycine-generating enzyme required for sulfatase activity
MILWLLGFHCTNAPCSEGFQRDGAGMCVTVEDTDTGDTGETDPCLVETPYTGSAVGSVNCTAGVCEVPAGAFWMGSTAGLENECPPREVTLSAFAIDATEVTRNAYASCVSAEACDAVPTHCDDLFGDWDDDPALGDPLLAPLICATWEQAAAYCSFVGGRLPTEAEWEKAARGEQGARWAWGHEPPDCTNSNHRFVSWYCHQSVVEVGSYPDFRTAYGLWDTVGNAWEWVADWYDAEWYRDAGDMDPQGPEADCRESVGGPATDCTKKVIRGGAFNTTEATTRGATRAFAAPGIVENNFSFRCAYDG